MTEVYHGTTILRINDVLDGKVNCLTDSAL